MKVFVSEFVSSGAAGEALLESSLRRAGAAMLQAAVEDFARIAGWTVVTTWDRRLGRFPVDHIDVRCVDSAEQERATFLQLAAESHATFVIAPELDGTLARRRRMVDSARGRFLGCTAGTIELCGDKLRLADHLRARGVPTIETEPFDPQADSWSDCPFAFPVVLKRRDGAGCTGMTVIEDDGQLRRFPRSVSDGPDAAPVVVQPLLRGRSLSVSAIVSGDGRQVELFPVGEQRIDLGGTVEYLGGRIPISSRPDLPGHLFPFCSRPVADLVRDCCRCLPGLEGYVGFDILLPPGGRQNPLIVEINPRLTSAYLGYRALTADNIAERILFPRTNSPPINWRSATVCFGPEGHPVVSPDAGPESSDARRPS